MLSYQDWPHRGKRTVDLCTEDRIECDPFHGER